MHEEDQALAGFLATTFLARAFFAGASAFSAFSATGLGVAAFFAGAAFLTGTALAAGAAGF